MARPRNLAKMSYAELVRLRSEIEGAIARKQSQEKEALKQKLAEIAKQKGFTIDELLGKGRRRGPVAIKYRDPKNPTNTWTGRGRMPRWMAAATKVRSVSKEDFLI